MKRDSRGDIKRQAFVSIYSTMLMSSEILENFGVSDPQLNTSVPVGGLLKVIVDLWSTFGAVSHSKAVARLI